MMNAIAELRTRTVTNMTSKGQVLIPKDVREAIGLIPGAPVIVGINDRGEAVVVPNDAERHETREQRLIRLEAAIVAARRRHATGRTADEIMHDLRGDEPLP